MANNFNWSDYEAAPVATSDKSKSFNWDDHPAEAPEVSKLESVLRGASQGLTFNSSDEITGAGEAGLKALTGQDSYEDLLKNYKKYRDESRAGYKAAEEANPLSYMAGDIGGGVATSLLSGGAGAVANLGKVGAKEALKALAKEGAKQGAAYAAGGSEADVLGGDVAGLAKDTAIGAGVGGVVGAALPLAVKGAGKALGAVGEVISDKAPALSEKASQAFDLASRGIDTVGKKARESVGEDANQIANKLIGDFRTQYKKGSEKVGNALKSKDSDIDFSTSLKELEDTLNTSGMLPDDLAKVQRELNNYKSITETETVEPGLKKAIDKMQKLIDQQQGEANVLGQSTSFIPQENTPGNKFLQTLKTTTEPTGEQSAKVMQVEIPEDEIIKNAVSNYKTLGLEDLNDIKKQVASTIGNSNIDKKSKSILTRLKGEVDSLITNSMDTANKGLYKEGNQDISNVYNTGNLIKELHPDEAFTKDMDIGLAKKLTSPGKADEVQRALQYGTTIPDDTAPLVSGQAPTRKTVTDETMQAVKDLPVRQQLSKDLQGESGVFSGFINPKGLAIRGGEAAGTIARKAEPLMNFTKSIVKSDDKVLGGIAQRLQTSGDENLSKFGSTLQKALTDTTKRDRLLWSLSQQPAFREYVNKISDEQQN